MPAETGTSVNFAYLVLPKGLFNAQGQLLRDSGLNVHVEVDTDPNQDPPLAILGTCDIFACEPIAPQNEQPIVGDLGPLVGDMSLNPPAIPTPVSGTLPATDDGGVANLTWMFTGVDGFTADP